MKKMQMGSLLIVGILALTAQAPLSAQAYTQVTDVIVRAIIGHESGFNPYAVNVAGRSFQPTSKAEALGIIAVAQAAGQNFDVGLMQINSWWMRKFNISAELLLDPEINVQWGTWILADEFERHGFGWVAIGKYHSPNLEKGRQYAWRIYQQLLKSIDNQASSREADHVEQTPGD